MWRSFNIFINCTLTGLSTDCLNVAAARQGSGAESTSGYLYQNAFNCENLCSRVSSAISHTPQGGDPVGATSEGLELRMTVFFFSKFSGMSYCHDLSPHTALSSVIEKTIS